MRSTSNFLQKLNNIDFSPIRLKLLEEEENTLIKSVDDLTKVEILYKLFLYLNFRYPTRKIVPSKEVDEYWHTHILFTKKYMSDCSDLFGGYLHHNPTFGLKNKKLLERKYLKSIDLMKLHIKEFSKNSNINFEELESAFSVCSDCSKCSNCVGGGDNYC